MNRQHIHKINLQLALICIFAALTALLVLFAGATQAHAATIDGTFNSKWSALGGAPGAATGNSVTKTLNRTSANGPWTISVKYQDFTNGRMYWVNSTNVGFQPNNGVWWIHGAILAKYDQLGREDGAYGIVISDEGDVAGVTGARMNSIENGQVYWGPGVGAYGINGDICHKYEMSGGAATFGLPASDEATAGSGKYQKMQKAVFTSDLTLGTHPVIGGIMVKYLALGGPTGAFGLAKTDEGNASGVSGARESDFSGGNIYWGPGVGAYGLSGKILDRYLAAPAGGPATFGLPTGDEIIMSGYPYGKFQNMQRATFTWVALGGNQAIPAMAITGAMWVKYMQMGGVAGYFSVAYSEEFAIPGLPAARGQTFTNGYMYWSPGTGAHTTTRLGISSNFDIYNTPATYGLPIDDEYDSHDGGWQTLEHAIITRNFSAGDPNFLAVRGGVMVKYQMMGGPGGALHLIIQEEHAITGVPGSPEAVVANFQNGNIYWALAVGSRAVNGGIYVKYLSVGGPTGALGLPLTDEYPIALPGGGARVHFQHGFITWGALYGTWVDYV